ncbi:ATP-binding cassette domain-containing protein [Paenibacillus donghaensis]|uniref:ABC transporter ATP-binding protein n=1 Tax=Paenibacillus donghaensis TaxID=414771 RepID=A0A2Z2KA96_9BACL|nr:ABC transporter ATP-binding protein [Paenibacillus donghaensis]ASA22397.1 ABC transporter ATP-binding protein [Paenibacillus donghaensis]
MSVILECSGLTKSYGKNEAVRHLNMTLEENTIYGLLGRNGAGKTTLLNMITGGIFPTSGLIEVSGSHLERGELPPETCYIRENNLYWRGARVIEILQFASAFHPHWDWPFAKDLLNTFKLNPSKKIRQLSRGMESLVGNIIGLASRARLTIYDEPMLGLDVLIREKFYRILVEDYANYPRTIVLSTHLIDEIAKVVESVYIMDAGTILLHDDVDHIREYSHVLTGSSEAVKQFTSDKLVIYNEIYGKGTLSALYGALGDKDRVQANKLSLTIEGLTLQKFFSYLVEGGRRIE